LCFPKFFFIDFLDELELFIGEKPIFKKKKISLLCRLRGHLPLFHERPNENSSAHFWKDSYGISEGSALQLSQFQLSRNSLVPAPRVTTPVIPALIIFNSCACQRSLPGGFCQLCLGHLKLGITGGFPAVQTR
jgi:hypothetical protein